MSVLAQEWSANFSKCVGLQLGILLCIAVLRRCFLCFEIRLMVPNCKTHQVNQIFGQKTKCSIFKRFHNHISSLLLYLVS